MTRIEELVIKVTEDLGEIRAILAGNTITLERNTDDIAHHIRRTDMLEARIARVEFPIKALKWVGGIIFGLATFLGALYQAIDLLR